MEYLISRQAAIDEWKNDFKGYIDALDIPKDDYKGIMEYIDELPSARPRGEWIEILDANEYGEPYPCGVHCSECGFCPVSLDNFCPNCGADMRGEQDGE